MKNRTEFARIARHCCDLALERDFISPLAIVSKLVPADISIDFFEISVDERLQYIAMYPAQSDLLRDAFHTKANGELEVKGTKDVPFPSTEPKPPQHKYAAVFDPRPCFDVIRSSFLRPTAEAAEGKGREMFRLLDELPDYGDRNVLKTKGFELAAMTMKDKEEEASGLPRGFMDFATRAYLKAIQHTQYYFSCEELLWSTECAKSNVIVAKGEGDNFRVEGAEFGGDGPVAVIFLQGEMQRRLHTHYERLCPQSWIDEGRAIASAIEEKTAARVSREKQETLRGQGLSDDAAAEKMGKGEQARTLAITSKLGSSSTDGVASTRPTDTVDVERYGQRRAADAGIRAEEECKALLRSSMGYAIQNTTAHGENNCLIEAILCALHSQGYLMPMRIRKRQQICSAARAHLVANHGVANEGLPYLSHDEHFDQICNFLRFNVPEIWPYARDEFDISDILLTSCLTITAQVLIVGIDYRYAEREMKWTKSERRSQSVRWLV